MLGLRANKHQPRSWGDAAAAVGWRYVSSEARGGGGERSSYQTLKHIWAAIGVSVGDSYSKSWSTDIEIWGHWDELISFVSKSPKCTEYTLYYVRCRQKVRDWDQESRKKNRASRRKRKTISQRKITSVRENKKRRKSRHSRKKGRSSRRETWRKKRSIRKKRQIRRNRSIRREIRSRSNS